MAELISGTENPLIAFLFIIVGALASLLAVYMRHSRISEATAKVEAKESQEKKDKVLQDSINVRDSQIAHLIEEGKANTALYQENLKGITASSQENDKNITEALIENTRTLEKIVPAMDIMLIIQDQLARMQENAK